MCARICVRALSQRIPNNVISLLDSAEFNQNTLARVCLVWLAQRIEYKSQPQQSDAGGRSADVRIMIE